MFYVLITLVNLSNSLVDIGTQCSCDQLLSKFECNYFNKCEFLNGVCNSLLCYQLDSYNCLTNSNCALHNNQCQEFTTCTDYPAKMDSDCTNLNHNCVFDVEDLKCKEQQESDLDCSQLSIDNCHYGKDGKCIFLQNQCQRWTQCEDASYDQCSYGAIHCVWSESKDLCVSVNQCEKIVDDLCLFAFPFMNNNMGYICQYEKGQCTQFQPSLQTSDTCIIQSFGYYQWKDNQCQQCNQNYERIISLILIIVALIN